MSTKRNAAVRLWTKESRQWLMQIPAILQAVQEILAVVRQMPRLNDLEERVARLEDRLSEDDPEAER